jgi:hypothetical protein
MNEFALGSTFMGMKIEDLHDLKAAIDRNFRGNIRAAIEYLDDAQGTMEKLFGHNVLMTSQINRIKKIVEEPSDDVHVKVFI